jgi:hypothetical protein
MAGFIVQQPNGRYCRFSTVVDCPTHINMTKEDYVNYLMDAHKWERAEAEQEANIVLTYYVRPFRWLDEYFREENMTKEKFEEYKKKMHDPPTEVIICN